MLKDMAVMHPAAKMLVDLAAAQDVEAGDGTTSVVVIAGSLLGAADKLLAKGASCGASSKHLELTTPRYTSYGNIGSLPASGRCSRRHLDRHVPANITVRSSYASPSRVYITVLQDCLSTLEPPCADRSGRCS